MGETISRPEHLRLTHPTGKSGDEHGISVNETVAAKAIPEI